MVSSTPTILRPGVRIPTTLLLSINISVCQSINHRRPRSRIGLVILKQIVAILVVVAVFILAILDVSVATLVVVDAAVFL